MVRGEGGGGGEGCWGEKDVVGWSYVGVEWLSWTDRIVAFDYHLTELNNEQMHQ